MASLDTTIVDPEEYRKKLALQLLQSGTSYEPIRSPWQGAARLAQALMGGLELRDIQKQGDQSGAAIRALAGDTSDDKPAQQTLGQQVSAALGNLSPMPLIDSYRSTTKGMESGGNPNAQSSTSSAGGLYGFTKGTWGDLIKNNPTLGLTPEGRFDSKQQEIGMNAFTAQNTQALGNAGLPTTPQNLRMAHFLGTTGGPAFLQGMQADPNSPATSLVSPQAAQANQNVFFNQDGSPKTAQQVYDQQTRQFAQAGGSQEQPQGQPQAQPQQRVMPQVPQEVQTRVAQLSRLGPPGQAAALSLLQPYLKPSAPELKETGTDPITGTKSFSEYDPNAHTMKPIGPGGTQGGATPQSGVLASGVPEINHSLTGDDYLNQFSPEVKAAVKSYINGDVMPTGNPRMQAIANFSKTIAQKYGQDTGVPVSDSLYSEKRKYRTDLGSTTPNSAGGQAKAFNQGIEHADALATTLEKLGNWNGLGIPMLASAANTVRQATSTEQADLATKAQGIGQTLAGEVGKLFSGTAGGGVHERELTRQRFNTVKSGPELAGALEATIETMRGGMTALEQRRDQVLGPNSDVKFVTPETEAKIARIQDVIARLRGQQTGGAAPQQQPGQPQQQQVQAPAAAPQIPQQAAAALKQNPQLRAQFEAKYGPGSAAGVLGGQ